MKCLSRTEMQAFIDKEMEDSLKKDVLGHLKECHKCSLLSLEVEEDKVFVNNFLNQAELLDERKIIPEFKRPENKIRNNKSYRFILDLVAASLIGFLLFSTYEKKSVTEKMTEADLLIYEFLDGKDLNKLWHDKSQIIIFQDSEGNVIESTIKY